MQPPSPTPVFTAVLTPHRSLNRQGFTLLMLLVCGLSFVTGFLFIIVHAWPVTFFVGLDALAIYIAFKLSYRQARAFEEITVSTHDVTVCKVSIKGERSETRFNPAWARLLIERMEDEGVVSLALTSHGKTLRIAEALSPQERASFAEALQRALRTAKAGDLLATHPV